MDDAAIYKLELDGRVVGKFGTAGKQPKEFGLVNAIDCRVENELLVGELTNWRVQKLRLDIRHAVKPLVIAVEPHSASTSGPP